MNFHIFRKRPTLIDLWKSRFEAFLVGAPSLRWSSSEGLWKHPSPRRAGRKCPGGGCYQEPGPGAPFSRHYRPGD